MARKETYEEWKARVHPEGGNSSSGLQTAIQNLGGNSGSETYEEWRARVHPEYQQQNSLGDSFNSFISGTQKLADQIGMNDFRSATDSYNALLEQRNYLDDYFYQNPTVIDANTYRDWKDFLGLFDNMGIQIQGHQDKLNFDFDANQAEVQHLNRILSEYDTLSRTMTDERVAARLAEIQDMYGDKDTIQAAITALETSANRARYYQQGYALGDVADPNSANYDPAFAQNSQYKPNNDTLSQYINDPAFRDEFQQMLRNAEVFGLNTYDDNYADLGYDKLTENETNLYNYYYNTGGKDAADSYLASIQETLNARAGYERYLELGDSALAKYAFAPEVGMDQFISSMRNLGDSVASHWGEGSEYIPTSSTQFAGAYTREDLADVGPQIFGSSLGQVVFDTGTTTFNMMPSILASVVSNTIAPGSGAYVGGALMGMSAAGGAYQEALNQGYTNEQARLYGYAIGASELVTSSIIGGISRVGGQVTNHVVANALSRVDSGVLRAIGKLGVSFTSEGMEEGLQEGLTPMIKRAILHQDSSIDWNAVGYSSMLGSLTALILEGAPTVAGEVNLTITGRRLIDAGVTAQRVAELGRSLSESEATELAERMLANPEKYANDAYSMGRLFNEVGAHLGEQNLIDITNKLVKLGMDQEMARKNAEVMSYVIDGGELTESDIAVLEANDVLAQAVKEAVIDPNASWNVRTREYMNMLDALENKPEQADVKGENQPPVEEAQPTTAEVKEPVKVEEPSPETVTEAQAIRISDKAPVEVQGVSSVRNGKVTLQLNDGTQVEAGELNFKDENEARLYDTISQMGKKLTANAANTLIRDFNAVRNDEAAAHNYVMGITEAFNYGKKGIPMRELSGTEYASTLNPGQQQYAWNRGQNVAGNQVAKDEASIRKLVKEAQEIIRSGRAVGTAREATVELTDGITEADLNDKQSQVYALANRIAPGMSLKVKVYSGKTTGWGYYDPKTDEVYLNLNANNKNRQTMMAHALGHELVHRAKLGSPAKYQAFAAFLMREYSKRGVSVEDMIEEQMQAAKEAGFEMTPEEAYEEVVCDACQTMLLDTDAGKKLAMFGAQSEQNKSILDEIRDWINDFMEKIRAYFADVEPDSMAAREFKKFDDNVKQILADMYVDMSIDAGENLSVIMHAFGKNTLVETNADGEFTVASNADGSKKLFNLTTWENGGRATLEATLIREGFTQKEVEAALTIMDEKQKMVMDIANELNDNGDLAFPEQGRINEATLTTDIKTGKSVMSALVTNGDYPINIDLLMVCKKRKAYQRVINRLCDTGMIEQATIDAMAIAQINKILGKYGFETACIGCFVESRRLRIQEWAETIVEEWNAEVKQRNPEAKPFGFGKGNAKLTQDEIIKLDYELRKGGKKNKQGNLNLGRGNAVARMGRLLDKVPSLQKTLTVEDLITPDGLAALRAMDGNLFSMVKSRYGSNSPKFVQEFNPYNHEIAMYGKPPRGYKNLREYLYAIGGARMQSFSDFIVENWFDYCQIVADLSARKLPMHTYTKEIALVKLFGMTGIKINMSLIPDIDRSMGREYAGLTRNAKGELELIWADKDRNKATGGKSYMQSINFADAIALQNDPRYSANIGTIAIGVSDIQIRMMLADPRVRMVIPYHSSGMNPVFAKMMGSDFYRNYTDYQNTTVKQLYNSEGQPVSLNLEKKQTEKLTGGFLWNKVLQETGDARAAAEAYKDWCADKSKHTVKIDGKTYTAELNPKFADFQDETNYYKLLTDFNPYDCITEEAAPQSNVQQIYPENFDKILKDELTAQEVHRQKQEKNQAFDKAMGEIEDYLKSHKTEKQLHEAGMKQKVPVAEKEHKKITMSMTDSERTEILKDKVITAEVYDGQADNQIHDNITSLRDARKNVIREAMTKIADEIGIYGKYEIDDIDVEFEYSKANVEETVSKKINPEAIAKLLPILGTAAKYAVGIESHANRYYYDTDTVRFDVLMSGYVEGKYFVPVRFGMKYRKAGEAILYVIVDQEKIPINKTKAEVVTIADRDKYGQLTARSAFKISIPSVIPFVNSGDLLRYIPDDMLTAAQKSIKWEAIADTIKTTNDKNDRRYSKYIQAGKINTAKLMVQQAAKMNGYPNRAWHQTSFEFTEFNTDNPVAGKNDSETPNGIFLKTNDHDIGIGGAIQMEVFFSSENMLRFKDRKEANAWYSENIPGYKELQDQMYSEISPINEEIESMEDEFFAPETTEERYDELSAIEDKLIAKMGKIEDEYRGKLRKLLDDYFLTGKSGYDGIELEYDGHRWVNGKREDVHTYIVFNPEQVKSADAITFDENNNVIPISQRFNPKKKDIRYKTPTNQEVSNRTLLEKAAEDPNMHEVLKKRIREYAANDDAFQKEEAKLLDIREEIRDLSLLNNKADAARIRDLQSEALKTAHRMDTLEGRLRRAESDKYLSQILKDERAKLTADQKPQSKPRTNLQNARATELSEWLREQRAMRQELTGREADTALIEREFIRLAKEYEKQGAKDTKKYDTLKDRMQKKVDEQRTDKQIWEREFKRLLREYDASGRKISRLEQRVEAQKNRAAEKVENRKKTDVREKILNLKDRLRKSLLSPTERMYVPVNLVNAMIDVCNLINEDTDIYKKDGSINKAQQNRIRMREKLQQLREEYEQLRTTSDPMYQGEFDEQVYDYLGKLRDRFSGKNIRELSLGELNEMYEYLKGIEETLMDAKKLIGWNDAITVYQAADSVVAEQGAITAKRKGKDRSHAQKVQDANYNLTLSPMRNVERMSGYNQDSYLYQFFRRFEQGVRKKNKFIMEAHKAFNDFTGIKDYDRTLYDAVGGNKYEDENGRKFGVSKMQMMQAILSWERETANDMNHIQGLGITFADLDKIEKSKMKDAVSAEYSHRVPAPMAINMIADFQEKLKNDKWAQDYMAAARKFFNDTAKNAINETTIALKHRIVAKDKNYIPFEADKNFIVNEISAENDIQETINSYGMLKDVKKGASQPIIVTGLNNVLERHIEKVANVYGLAIEVRNFNKVWNAKSDAAGVTRTVKGSVEKNWGAGGVKSITQAVQDIQGPRTRSDNALYKKIKSNYINATFLLNFSVVTKQIGSLFSATSMLRWRNPVRMLFNLGSTMIHHKKIAAEVDKYTATAWMRKQGISDAELDNFMTEGKGTLWRRIYDKLFGQAGKAIAFMDYSVALSLWKYAKIDTQKRTKLEGEELLRETAKFYDDLVEQTQSMADVLHRPEAQKKEGVIAESFGLFKTDLYQMAGQLQNAAGRFGANKTKANAKAVTKTVTAIAGSALWAQLMTSMFALLRYKVNQYRDEEDKDLTVESWLKRQKFSIAADLIGYLFPLFGSELVGIFEKFAYGESDVLVDNLALTAINDLSELAFEVAASIKDGEMPDTEDLLNLATKSLQLLGVPANNIMRSYNALRLHGRDFLNGKLFSFEAGINRTPTEHIYRVMDAINDGDTAEAVELFNDAVEEGAMERAENGIFGTDEIKQSESALRDRVGEMYREGDISATMTRTLLMECFDLDKDEVDLMLAKWDFKMEYGYSWSDKGDAYLNHDISARDLRELLIEIDGKTEEEADDYIKDLDFEMEYGWAYDSRVTEYVKGNVTDSELRMALINYGGMSIENADTYMKVYRWIKNNPEYDLTVDRVKMYLAPIKNLGISIEEAGIRPDVFNDYADLRADCEGVDADGDGKADRDSIKNQIIPIIDSLPITDEQKDVLYIQNGWAQSGLRNTPWH